MYIQAVPNPDLSLFWALLFSVYAAGFRHRPSAIPTNNNQPITSETTQTQFVSLTPSATVVRDCQREAQQRVPVVWNAMCCQTRLANIYINTNSLQPRDQIIKRADAEADVSQRSEAA